MENLTISLEEEPHIMKQARGSGRGHMNKSRMRTLDKDKEVDLKVQGKEVAQSCKGYLMTEIRMSVSTKMRDALFTSKNPQSCVSLALGEALFLKHPGSLSEPETGSGDSPVLL